ncbi:hypothetical protein LSH36_427g01031 [Paralvinella palmiformis]|uniref:ATP-binding cassette sub-family B member 10, mitochondrial n=1 Tax=Paralvinella palmiformis TaxID=53620 RepID=A0AAD9JBY0_9ANNE|nr:hypothetical protein LSH36_427g01031 [Paralvinella palmiformis]
MMSLLLRTCVAASSRNVIIQEFSSLPRTSHLNLERKCLSLWHRCARCHHHLLSKGFKETSQLFTYTSAPRLMSFRGLCNRTWSRKLLGNNAYINNVIRRVYSTRAEVIKEAGELSKQGRNAVKAVKRIPQVNEIKRLFGLAKSEKMKLAAAVFFLLISSAVTMAVPFGIGRVIDIIYSKADDGNMVKRLRDFCIVLLAVFICGAGANYGRVYFMQMAGNRIIKNLRDVIFRSIIRQEIAFFDKVRTGELINRLSTDTTIVGTSVTMNISDGLRSVTQAIGGITMMAYMSGKLTLVALSIVPPLIIMSRTYGRYVQKITKRVQDSLAESTQVAEERLSNMRTVRAFGQEPKEIATYEERTDHVLLLSKKEAIAKGIFWATTGLSGNVMILSLIYTGGMMMSEAQITVGELSSFLMYAAFVGVSFGGMSSFYSELMRGIGASSRLWNLVDRVPSIPMTAREELPILSRLNLEVDKGRVLAVVGASGSGKSTIASLILRYYDVQGGHLLVDGRDIRDYSPQWMRSHIGVVSQEPSLFSCSIAENITYGAVDASQVTTSEIIEAAKMANAYDFIQGFPDGLDTLVGERGIMLSGGQKQRIAIARAIIKNPKILLLDEATSALDAESEFLVQEALDRIMVGRTVITIAHRLSTIKNADKIAVLHDGAVAEIGTYGELMSIKDGLFRRLVERQTIAS